MFDPLVAVVQLLSGRALDRSYRVLAAWCGIAGLLSLNHPGLPADVATEALDRMGAPTRGIAEAGTLLAEPTTAPALGVVLLVGFAVATCAAPGTLDTRPSACRAGSTAFALFALSLQAGVSPTVLLVAATVVICLRAAVALNTSYGQNHGDLLGDYVVAASVAVGSAAAPLLWLIGSLRQLAGPGPAGRGPTGQGGRLPAPTKIPQPRTGPGTCSTWAD